MKAACIEGFCDADGIRYRDLPDPVPGPGEALVRVEAVAVNNVDTLVRSGRWRTPAVFPLSAGRDLVGTVTAIHRICWERSHGGRAAGRGLSRGLTLPGAVVRLPIGCRILRATQRYGGPPKA